MARSNSKCCPFSDVSLSVVFLLELHPRNIALGSPDDLVMSFGSKIHNFLYEGPSSCAGHQGSATTAPAPTCYAKTRLASYSIRFLASQQFNTDNSLHQCRAFILFLDVSTMRTFVYQFGIAFRDAYALAILCAADKRGSRSTPNA